MMTTLKVLPIDAVPGQAETVVALRSAGVSAGAIGRYVGRHTSTIDQWLRRRGVFSYIRRPLSAAERTTINRLLREKWSLSEIGREIDRPVSTVRKYGLAYGTYVGYSRNDDGAW